MTWSIHPQAEAELGDAAEYYATRANRAIALAFLAGFERVLGLLIENPQRGPHCDDGLRVSHFDRFPFTVIYAADDMHGPQNHAVAHQRREPGYWGDRVQPRQGRCNWSHDPAMARGRQRHAGTHVPVQRWLGRDPGGQDHAEGMSARVPRG